MLSKQQISNKKHLLHLVGILFPHIYDDAGQNHFKFTNFNLNLALTTYSESGEMWGAHGGVDKDSVLPDVTPWGLTD